MQGLLDNDECDGPPINAVMMLPMDFNCSTRIDLATDRYYHVSPFFEANKFLIKFEMENEIRVVKTSSPYSMWGWLRAIRQCYKFWTTYKKIDKPQWAGGQFRAPMEFARGSTDGETIVGTGSLSLAKGAEFKLTLTYQAGLIQLRFHAVSNTKIALVNTVLTDRSGVYSAQTQYS